MHNDLKLLPGNARVWIYQAHKELKSGEMSYVKTALAEFMESWNAHGALLSGAASVVANRFLVIAVDESANKASGCSIDKSVAIVRQMGEYLGVDFFVRTDLPFLDGQTQKVFTVPMNQLKSAITAGEINENTLFFNTQLHTLDELRNKWPQPAGETWLSRYFALNPA